MFTEYTHWSVCTRSRRGAGHALTRALITEHTAELPPRSHSVFNRCYAVGKNFDTILNDNRVKANELRLKFKKLFEAVEAQQGEAEGVLPQLQQEGRALRRRPLPLLPCSDWLARCALYEIEASDGGLKDTFYEDMPGSMKPKHKVQGEAPAPARRGHHVQQGALEGRVPPLAVRDGQLR